MCPDREILSVYFDHELPSPWKEKMEAHLAECPACQFRLAQYQGLASSLREVPAEGGSRAEPGSPVQGGSPAETAPQGAGWSPEAVRERVWERIAGSGKIGRNWPESTGISRPPAPGLRPSIWRRSVSLPLPAAAAAAALVVLAVGAAFFGRSQGSSAIQDAVIAAGIDLDVQGMMTVSDLNGVIQYLSKEDTADMVIIRLPESRNFMSSGEPTLIRATDYSRRKISP